MIVRALKMQATPPVVLAEYEAEAVPRIGEVLTISEEPFAVRGVIHSADDGKIALFVEPIGRHEEKASPGSSDNEE
jgi:hypothetical protein